MPLTKDRIDEIRQHLEGGAVERAKHYVSDIADLVHELNCLNDKLNERNELGETERQELERLRQFEKNFLKFLHTSGMVQTLMPRA